MKIPFVHFGKQYLRFKDEIDAAQQRVQIAGDLILRQDVEQFERNLAELVGTKYAIGLNSGTDALRLVMRALDICAEDEVITVSHTFVATIEAIVDNGATPILIDIDDNYLMDVGLIEKAITPRTKAIIPVHLSGDLCDMQKILEIAAKYNLLVIEDAAQALGASDEGGYSAGARGVAGCFSFYPAKILGAPGDAGAVTTNDEKLADKLRKLRHHYYIGKNLGVENDLVEYGVNSRLDNIHAAVLNVKIKHLQDLIDRRLEVARAYDEALDFPGLILPRKRAVYQDYVIRTEERDGLRDFLKSAGIETLGADLIPNHFYKGLGLDFNLPKTEKYTNEFLRLPCNAEISNGEVAYVIKNVRDFFGQ